jgi:hypothetical protein
VWLALPFVAAAVIVNIMPFEREGHTEVLAALHLPIALWLAVGFAYAGGLWRSHDRRMNFVRFSGEWFIYYTLIALGGVVLVGFTMFIFDAIGLRFEWAVQAWVMPCGVVGAVIISAWLAALGENLILLVNLGWSAVLYTRFLRKRASFAPLERWQMAYIPVYGVWAWIVVAFFPILFNYR